MRRRALLLAVLALSGTTAAACGGRGGVGERGTTNPPQPTVGASGGQNDAAGNLGFPAFATKNTTRVGGADAVANAAGVSRAVFLSFRGADAGNDNPFRQTELALLASGTGATVIRPSLFSQNFTEGFLAPPIRGQAVIAAPAGTGRVPFIDAGDIAAVAAAALLNDGHAGRAYDLSGPRVLSFADAAATLSAATGRTIGYLDVPPTDWQAGTIAAGVPADYARFLSVLFETLRAGQHDYLADGVQQVLGRQPRAFGDWAHAEAAQIPAR